MKINTIFKEFVGRDINLSNINYDDIYNNEDLRAATALMYLLQHYDYKVPQCYSFEYDKQRGIYSYDLIEDILEQNNESEDVTFDEDIVDLVEYVNLSLDIKRKITSGLISAVQYHYYDKHLRRDKRSEEDYINYFPQRHPKDSYKLGKHSWKSLKGYQEARRFQPE